MGDTWKITRPVYRVNWQVEFSLIFAMWRKRTKSISLIKFPLENDAIFFIPLLFVPREAYHCKKKRKRALEGHTFIDLLLLSLVTRNVHVCVRGVICIAWRNTMLFLPILFFYISRALLFVYIPQISMADRRSIFISFLSNATEIIGMLMRSHKK